MVTVMVKVWKRKREVNLRGGGRAGQLSKDTIQIVTILVSSCHLGTGVWPVQWEAQALWEGLLERTVNTRTLIYPTCRGKSNCQGPRTSAFR